MARTKYINVVSGKGGTGKTLLCTILAELMGNQNLSVLVVDMDIFVRGLTALLYFHRGESIRLTNDNESTVSDIFYRLKPSDLQLAIHKYRSFDIAPAVSRINQLFEFEKEMIFDFEHNQRSFDRILKSIPREKYDYIFFDCRAGYDSLVSTIHENSDMTICVQEEDDISEVTANNLIQQLERDSSRKTIYKIINKARNIRSYDDLEKKQRQGLTTLGYIPFDMDVMNSFGEKSFWDDISRSLYKSAVAQCWNRLSAKAELNDTLNFKRYSPLMSEKIERSFGFLGSADRLLGAMGLLVAILGFVYSIFGEDIKLIFQNRPDKAITLFMSLIGLFLFVFSFLRSRKH